ncbi:hypothetical protein JOB18_002514 [Solea senegalensis]|uniref:Uncharacterized protein n=1 Tax=Solea senegalensis TaxID=28829 RepID=A0AAV6Q4E2_SOLSE|nr:hypothetical protein JOB18_002514 [Solea senegalensis]
MMQVHTDQSRRVVACQKRHYHTDSGFVFLTTSQVLGQIIEKVTRVKQERYLIKAVSQGKQGTWTRWVDTIHRFLTWKVIWQAPQARLSFTVSSGSAMQSHSDKVYDWGKRGLNDLPLRQRVHQCICCIMKAQQRQRCKMYTCFKDDLKIVGSLPVCQTALSVKLAMKEVRRFVEVIIADNPFSKCGHHHMDDQMLKLKAGTIEPEHDLGTM